MMTLCLSHSDPDPPFQPLGKAHVFYVYVILSFASVALPMSRAVAICPTGMKRKAIGSNTVSKWAFLCTLRLNITYRVLQVE